MSEITPPFLDDGEGFPTPDSVRNALEICRLGVLADIPTQYRDPEGVTHEGTISDLVGHCRIEHLIRDWPKGFISHVVGATTQAVQGSSES